MVEKKNDEKAREERARRLRDQIERLKSGKPPEQPPGKPKSIREQVDDAARKKKP